MPMIDPAVEAYAERRTTAAPPALGELVERARQELPTAAMISGNVVGRLLETLVFALQPTLVLEIGTYAGTSALWLARALPADGRVVTCEVDERAAAFARAAWAEAGEDRIELRMGPALETIAALDGPIDLVFVDADKESYPDYLDAVLPKLAPRGIVVADNTLRDGRVLVADGTGSGDEGTEAIARFNDRVASDPALVATFLTVRDGVTLIRRA
jgi:caffeoyl-CoA O-methyltransferase